MCVLWYVCIYVELESSPYQIDLQNPLMWPRPLHDLRSDWLTFRSAFRWRADARGLCGMEWQALGTQLCQALAPCPMRISLESYTHTDTQHVLAVWLCEEASLTFRAVIQLAEVCTKSVCVCVRERESLQINCVVNEFTHFTNSVNTFIMWHILSNFVYILCVHAYTLAYTVIDTIFLNNPGLIVQDSWVHKKSQEQMTLKGIIAANVT